MSNVSARLSSIVSRPRAYARIASGGGAREAAGGAISPNGRDKCNTHVRTVRDVRQPTERPMATARHSGTNQTALAAARSAQSA